MTGSYSIQGCLSNAEDWFGEDQGLNRSSRNAYNTASLNRRRPFIKYITHKMKYLRLLLINCLLLAVVSVQGASYNPSSTVGKRVGLIIN